MPNIGVWEIVIVVVIALLIFGPKKLPELGSSLGRSITGFKKCLKETKDDLQTATKEESANETVAGTSAAAGAATTTTTATATPPQATATAATTTSTATPIPTATTTATAATTEATSTETPVQTEIKS
jgi:sec-independent protein translocase protein TatA